MSSVYLAAAEVGAIYAWSDQVEARCDGAWDVVSGVALWVLLECLLRPFGIFAV